VRNSDKIVVLDDGNVAGIGTHDELFNSCEVYKEICLSQLNKDEAGKPAGNTQNPSAETVSSSVASKDGSYEASKAEALAENGKEAE
jgi:ABC-type multidrug transport system ATPase subunit